MSDQRGLALVIAMVLLAMLAFLGAAAMMTSSTEMDIAGNERAYQMAFYSADGGTELAPRAIRDTVNPDFGGFGSGVNVDVNCFRAELLDFSGVSDSEGNACNDGTDVQTVNPDIQFALAAGLDVSVDVDRIGTPQPLPGGGIEFGSGYEGIGTGSATGGSVRYYLNNSESSGPRNASSLIESQYRLVIGTPGGS
jgi:Tfp pilus assembly protein PilX